MQQPGNNLCADCGVPGEYAAKDSHPQYIHFDMISSALDYTGTTVNVWPMTNQSDFLVNKHIFVYIMMP